MNTILVDEISLNNVIYNYFSNGVFDDIIKKCLSNYIGTDYIDKYFEEISLESNLNIFNLISDNIQVQLEENIYKRFENFFNKKYDNELNKFINNKLNNPINNNGKSDLDDIINKIKLENSKKFDENIFNLDKKFKDEIESQIKDYNGKMKSKLDNYKRVLNKDMYSEYNSINLNVSALDYYTSTIKQYNDNLKQNQIVFEEDKLKMTILIDKLIDKNNILEKNNLELIEQNKKIMINYNDLINNNNKENIIKNIEHENKNIIKKDIDIIKICEDIICQKKHKNDDDIILALKIQNEYINFQLEFETKIEREMFNMGCKLNKFEKSLQNFSDNKCDNSKNYFLDVKVSNNKILNYFELIEEKISINDNIINNLEKNNFEINEFINCHSKKIEDIYKKVTDIKINDTKENFDKFDKIKIKLDKLSKNNKNLVLNNNNIMKRIEYFDNFFINLEKSTSNQIPYRGDVVK